MGARVWERTDSVKNEGRELGVTGPPLRVFRGHADQDYVLKIQDFSRHYPP